ncbi:MAG TPA: hypothetical protein VF666_14625 [Pyrinomonadaceae bacterium]|jgi:hypothetical protein
MGLTYEFHADATLPGLERLWRDATDWGEAALDGLRPWFEAAPFGKPSVVVASDEQTGATVGQFRFMPSQVSVNGRVFSAVRPFGTIVKPEAHEAADIRSPLDSPIARMYLAGVNEFQARGVSLVYTVPDQRWLGLFKRWVKTLAMFRLDYGTFPLWSLSLPLQSALPSDAGYSAAPLVAWDERVDRLWQKFSRLHGCTSLRDAATLQWKLSNANYTTTAIERDGELVGLVASRRKGDRQWLICDMLVTDDGDALRATLSAVTHVAHEKSLSVGVGEEAIHKVAVLATPLMEPTLKDLGFARDDYDFPIAIHILDESIKAEDVAPSRWYVSAND